LFPTGGSFEERKFDFIARFKVRRDKGEEEEEEEG